ncbi:MAG: PTS system nitrogen regulatory IIA component, partial [Verrucomicrobiales bacterium]
AKNLHEFHQASTAKMHDLSAEHALIPDLMQPSYIQAELPARTRGSVIRGMVALADKTDLLLTPEDLQTSVEEREALCSTALTGGFALLHAHVHEPWMFEDSFIALGRTVSSIPFGSPDGQTSNLFFLVCSQDDKIHLHMLARLSMLAYHTSVLLELNEAETAEDMYEALVTAELEVLKG